ncbi:GD14011 [Drosophila simulans]|uniref:GD14011 n=1 Tax=Drosophila simulans TaxID=7240 RepID=B4QKE0_DROSI|nr:GD14011 [Drosophila simulans]
MTSGELGGARVGAQHGPSRSDVVIECLPSLSELELQLPSSLMIVALQGSALKRASQDVQEIAVAAKKAKPNNIHAGSADTIQKLHQVVGNRAKNLSEDAVPRSKDHRNVPGLYQQLHQNPSRDRLRKFKRDLEVQHPTESFRDIGGMDSTLKELCEMLIHIKSPEFYFQLGLLPSRGLLLHGPPGCGKTFLARAISGQLKMPLMEIPATELIGGISGESEERIREVFDQAIGYSPCVLFIDEIDAIGGNRQWASKDMERRIVSQLISSLDNLKANEFGQSVVVIAATTRPDVLDPGLRRIGRFDHEIAIHIPSRKERREILRIQCEGLSVDPKLNYDKIAELTPGYVGADLMALVSRAASVAVKRVLLCGPPGCGKTLLAKAIANEAGINFISVKGPELMNMYVGESERAVRACFQRARNSAPCVIFFDEFDSLCPKRSDGGDGNNSGTRIVNQLLTEMDGVEERKGVYILAATNRPDIIDPAILRPGRLDTILYVGFPEQSERTEILKATTKNGKRPLLADDVDLDEIAAQTEGYTGADLAGLVKQASMFSLRQSLNNGDTNLDDLCVRSQHFKEALQQLRPSVNEQDRKIYDKLRLKYAAPRVPSPNDK